MKNSLGTIHAFEACRQLPNLRKFMYVATDEVYGECEGADHPMNERDVLLPRSPYSASKAFGSLIHVAYENTYPELKGKVVETRMSNIFGARQDTTKILPQIKKSLEEGYSIPLHNNGEGYRQYLYVKNVPASVELLLEKGSGVYNVTAREGLTVRELIAKAEEITGKSVTTHPANRPGMDRRYEMDGSRLRELGFVEEYSFEAGLREYLGAPKKKIVIGTNDLLMAGAQRLAIDQLRLIDRSQFEVHLVILMEFPGQGTFDDLIPPDVTVHRLHFKGLKDVRTWWKLLKLLRRVRPAVVKTATFFSNIAFLALKPFVGYEVITAEHNTTRVKPFWQRVVDRVYLPQSYTIVADSKSVVDFVVESEGVDRSHFTILYNGVDLDAVASAEAKYHPERAKIRAELDVPSSAEVIFNAGRLVEQKHPQLMIKGFAKLYPRRPHAYLVMAGSGKFEQELKDLAEELGVSDRVRLIGEQKNLHRLYAASDVFLLTSRHEGFCIAAMEGLAFGLPLISTKVAGVSEYLEDGVNGFFVVAEPEDVADKLERVLALSTTERTQFAKAAKQTAEGYSTKRYGEEFNAIAKRALTHYEGN
jgi:glycosyltransferase involved in cell wall biosynthesis